MTPLITEVKEVKTDVSSFLEESAVGESVFPAALLFFAAPLVRRYSVAVGILLLPIVSVIAQGPSGGARAQSPATAEFEVASVKLVDPDVRGSHFHEHSDPRRIALTGTMHSFILRCYGIISGQLGNEPDWFKTQLYSIEGVASTPATADQMTEMLRNLLSERFQLKLHRGERDLAVFALEIAKGGPKFEEWKQGEAPQEREVPPGNLARRFTSLTELTSTLNSGGNFILDRPVIDRTHLVGKYNIQLITAIETQPDDSGRRTQQFPNLLYDLQSQLGLKLVSDHVSMPYYTVEHSAKPTPN